MKRISKPMAFINMVLTIHGELTDLNTYINSERSNLYIAAKIKKAETYKVGVYAKHQKFKITKRFPTIMSTTWYMVNKKKDPDNIAFAKKFILDGLRDAKVLPNDGWNEISGFIDLFEVDAKNPRVEVEFI